MLEASRRSDEAVAALEHSLTLGPENGRMHGELATLLYRLGRWPEAATHARRARALGYVDDELWRALVSAGVLAD